MTPGPATAIDPDDPMHDVDRHVRALVYAWNTGGLNPTGPIDATLDPARRRAVLTLYIRWIVAALRLPCDHCGETSVQGEVT